MAVYMTCSSIPRGQLELRDNCRKWRVSKNRLLWCDTGPILSRCGHVGAL